MDNKTKSIIVGLGSAFAAVAVIILLFFSLSGIGKNNDAVDVSNKEQMDAVSNVVQSDGNLVVPFEDDDSDNSDNSDEVSSQSVSSQDTSSVPQVQEADYFGRSDIEGITKGIDKFSEYVAAVNPVSYEWNTASMGATGEVEVKLITSDGSFAVIGVPYDSSDYTVDGKTEGSGENVKSWTVYKKNKSESCRAKQILFLSNKMKFTMPRNVKIGASYSDITSAYLRKDNPDKTYLLYEGTDVLTDEAKLNAYKKDKSAYIGGKIYKLSTYLNSFYKDNNDAYPLNGKCNNIIRYGYNSIEDTAETSGQWYIEYATQKSKLAGVYFYFSGIDD